MSIVLICAEESHVTRSDEDALAKANAIIKSLQTENQRLREQLDESAAAVISANKAYLELIAARL